jgi:N-acetyl sugar amidotransferase
MCSRCLLDEITPGIAFDEAGQCNYCRDFQALLAAAPGAAEYGRRRDALIGEIKRAGMRKRYDCVVGVSGGVDSSYALYLAVKSGLRPLAVHLDNGWNSELAVHNIATLVRTLGVDLYTHVIRWEENRDLQRAFMAAHVIDIEMLMDSAMLATNFRAARKFGVRFILSGSNSTTEGMVMPAGWNHHKWDARNARAIHGRFGTRRVPSHPLYSLREMFLDRHVRRIRWLSFLDYFDYRKADAVELLQRELGYKPYPYKHYESVFTRFYQGYLLPYKFGVDKRKPHLSSLMMSGEMTRDEALQQASGIAYPSAKEMESDRRYFLKKMGWSEEKFADYMSRPPRPHSDYPSEALFHDRLLSIYRRLNLKFGRLTWG